MTYSSFRPHWGCGALSSELSEYARIALDGFQLVGSNRMNQSLYLRHPKKLDGFLGFALAPCR